MHLSFAEGEPRLASARNERRPATRAACTAILLGCLAPTLAAAQDVPGAAAQEQAAENVQRIVKEGIEITFSIEALEKTPGVASDVIAGQNATVRFRITDTATGAPLSGLSPAAWMDRQKAGAEDFSCKDKTEALLQGSLTYRPEVDLNAWYILTLNQEGSIGVIDPLLGFGGQQLLAMPPLGGAGEDWVLTHDRKKLLVTLPTRDEVAVIDTAGWTVSSRSQVQANPTRIALQPDGRYAWVVTSGHGETGAEGGVTVLDTETLRTVARIPTGPEPHDIAFTSDDGRAVVIDRAEGTASIIDIAALAKVGEVEIGSHPIDVAYSPLSESFYVIDDRDGAVVVLDGTDGTEVARLDLGPDLTAIGMAPGGRWVLVTDAASDSVHVLDASTNQVVQSAEVGPRPYQVAFTEGRAYIRLAGSEEISSIPLSAFGAGKDLTVHRFAGGRTAPGHAGRLETAPAIAPAPEGTAVLVSNPVDRTIYYYMEGMNAPSGGYRNAGQQPRGVLALDRSLDETAPGEYATTVRLPVGGTYDVPILLDAPALWHCFTATVHPGVGVGQDDMPELHVNYLLDSKVLPVGDLNLRFALEDPATGRPAEVEDVRILALRAPGTWQKRIAAEPIGDGLYEAPISLASAGAYYIFIESASLGLRYNDLPFLILRAEAERQADAGSGKE